MELEDLKKAWEELNSRITRNELTNQRILTDMIMQRKESVFRYFSRWEKSSVVGTIFAWAVVVYAFCTGHTPLFMNILLLVLMLAMTIITFVGFSKWKKIKQWERTDAENQIRHILEYSLFVKIMYAVVYILVLPVIVYAYYLYPKIWGLLTAVILIGILADYFVYHSTSDRLKDLSGTIRELEELKKIQD